MVEGQRHLWILDTDHGVIELVIPISTCTFRRKRERGVTLKLAVSVVRGMVVEGD